MVILPMTYGTNNANKQSSPLTVLRRFVDINNNAFQWIIKRCWKIISTAISFQTAINFTFTVCPCGYENIISSFIKYSSLLNTHYHNNVSIFDTFEGGKCNEEREKKIWKSKMEKITRMPPWIFSHFYFPVPNMLL